MFAGIWKNNKRQGIGIELTKSGSVISYSIWDSDCKVKIIESESQVLSNYKNVGKLKNLLSYFDFYEPLVSRPYKIAAHYVGST